MLYVRGIMMVNKPIKILLVEDNPADARWTFEVFKDSDIKNEFFVVKDGIEALHYLRHHAGYKKVPCPDIILLDLNLPRMNGFELLKEIKDDEYLKSTPVVLLISSNYPPYIKKAKKYANYCIRKPVNFDHILKILHCIDSIVLDNFHSK